MKIAILGTRGIPNNYGGFEQFAEYLSMGLVTKGHFVTVYSSQNHPFQKSEWNGVNIYHIFDPEELLGTAGQFIYDFFCIMDSKKRNFDVILQLGYTSNSIWGWLLPKKSVIVTNMDGLEWKRSKYSKTVRKFLEQAEGWAVNSSDYLISDSLGVKNYLKEKYRVDSEFIAYGATVFNHAEFESIGGQFPDLIPYKYDMLIARMEPENNIETILKAKINSKSKSPLLLIGNTDNKFGGFLKQTFSSDERIQFLGSIYDIQLLNNLRHYSNLYLHGHSVGGTNPSLLEAMASGALICAHNNVFNETILGTDALYFKNHEELTMVFNSIEKKYYMSYLENNYEKILRLYNWPLIINKYEDFIKFAYKAGKK